MNQEGRFVWHELMTTDPERAQQFFAELLGWTTTNFSMEGGETYTMIQVGEQTIGGYEKMETGGPAPPHWLGYVTVEDVDAAAGRAEAMGGALMVPPNDISNVGRFAVLRDPAGAVFALYKSANESNEEMPERPASHTFCWDELLTPDPDAVAPFYGELFGWSTVVTDMGHANYILFRRGEKDAAGCMPSPPGTGNLAAWVHYVLVDDVDALAERTTELGGSVTMPPTDIPEIGRFTVICDPTGAQLGLFQASH